jgi:L-lactate dehydrogenase
VEAILKDQRAILTICSPLDEVAGVKNVTLSLPHLVGGDGVLNTLYPPMDEAEMRLLRASAEIVAADIALLE